MRVLVAALALAATQAVAQPVVAPTPDRPDRVEEAAGFQITNSFEVGYRFADVSGNADVYRANVNYGNGMRLLEGQLRVNSLDGRGRFLDELSFNTSGAGTDPYQSHTLRAEKTAWYRYDLQVRLVRYANQLPSVWSGERGFDTERLFQTHDLTLFPGRRVEILLGYDRNKRTGPGFTTTGLTTSAGAFDRGDFLRFRTDLRQMNNHSRAGINIHFAGLALTAIQSYDNYREDTLYADASALDFQLDNVQQVDDLARHEPFHGNTPATVVALRTEKERWIGFQGRFTYSGGRRNSILSERLTAIDQAASLSTLRQTFILGGANRAQGTGEATVTLLPSPKWTITNTSAVNNLRIDGAASFLEVTSFENRFIDFDRLATRHITNATEASYRPVRELSLYGAYRFSTRRIRSSEAFEFPEFEFRTELAEVDNDVHAGAGGVRWMPVKGVRASFDVEVGRADRPLTPRSPRKYHNESARVQWRGRGATVVGFFKSDINSNPADLVGFSSDQQSAGFHASWARPSGRVTLDGGYTYRRLDTAASIFNLFEPQSTEARTYYTSNLHNVSFGSRLVPQRRVTLYFGYALAKDTGRDGGLPASPDFTPAYPNVGFDGVSYFQSFPLTYQSPRARISVELTERLSWNFGYQRYSYSERLTSLQDYRANVGYSSFRWSF